MSLNKSRAWVAGVVVVWLLISVAAWFLLISPKRAEAQDLRDQTVAAEQKNAQTETRIESLKKQAAQLPQLQAKRDDLRKAMPKDDELAELTRRFDTMATETNVILDSITPSTPAAVAATATATTETQTQQAADAASESGSADSAATTTTTAAASTGLVEVPVTVTVTSEYSAGLNFLKRLQTDDGRNYLVKSISVGDPKLVGDGDVEAAKAKGWVTMTITGSVFALPEGATASAATTGSTSSAGSAATATDTTTN